MIFGSLSSAERSRAHLGPPCCRTLQPFAALAWRRPWGVAGLDLAEGRIATQGNGSWLVWSGRAWWRAGSTDKLSRPLTADRLLERLLNEGVRVLDEVAGSFAVAWFEADKGELGLARDRFGVEPLHYSREGDTALFASQALAMRDMTQGPWQVGSEGLRDYLVYGYCPGQPILIDGVRRVLPGGVVRLVLQDGQVAETVATW